MRWSAEPLEFQDHWSWAWADCTQGMGCKHRVQVGRYPGEALPQLGSEDQVSPLPYPGSLTSLSDDPCTNSCTHAAAMEMRRKGYQLYTSAAALVLWPPLANCEGTKGSACGRWHWSHGMLLPSVGRASMELGAWWQSGQ